MKPLISGHPEWWARLNNGQLSEDRTKLVQIPYKKALNSGQKWRVPIINGKKFQVLFGLFL